MKPASRTAWLLGLITAWLLVLILLTGALLIGWMLVFGVSSPMADARTPKSKLTLKDIPFDGAQAYEYLKQICDLGPRVSGSAAMTAQQKLLTDHFTQLGGTVERQGFRYRHPVDGTIVEMANLIVRWHPERKKRILIAAHYDTRPIPDQDPNPSLRRLGVFVGANDGASGVALLMELGKHMTALDGPFGVDFVLLDAEEFVFDAQRDPYFLGSEWFSRQYVAEPPDYKYVWGVLVDLIGDADLQIFQERNSMLWADTRPLVKQLWETAARLNVEEFIPRPKHTVNDDHIKLRNVGKIPTCDVIDFDYPHWHTARDTANKCSALSLAKVGWVIHEWLQNATE